MNPDLINKLNKGIYLEVSNQLLPWKTEFNILKNYSKAEFRKASDERVDLIFRNEKILDGLNVDLIIMRWFGFFGMNKKLTYVYANISQTDFESLKEKLNFELGQIGVFKKFTEFEFRYKWKLKNCTVKILQEDRFGTYWTIEIKHKSSWYGLFR